MKTICSWCWPGYQIKMRLPLSARDKLDIQNQMRYYFFYSEMFGTEIFGTKLKTRRWVR